MAKPPCSSSALKTFESPGVSADRQVADKAPVILKSTYNHGFSLFRSLVLRAGQ